MDDRASREHDQVAGEQAVTGDGVGDMPAPEAAGVDGALTAGLTGEARQLVARADDGGVPMFTSANLARIARDNGVSVSEEMTPNEIIEELRRRVT